jgi:hypothetical protein
MSKDHGIVEILEDLTPQSPVTGINVDGFHEEVSGFITFDKRNNLVYFSQVGGGLVIVDVNKLYFIEFGGV